MIERLTPRERLLIGGALLLFTGTILYLAVFAPYRTALKRFDQTLTTGRQQLHQARQTQQEILALRQDLSRLENRLDRAPGFNALVFMEELVGRVARREQLTFVRPKSVDYLDDLVLEALEMKVEGLDLAQVLGLLAEIEEVRVPLRMTELNLKRRYDDRARLDLTLTIVATRRAE